MLDLPIIIQLWFFVGLINVGMLLRVYIVTFDEYNFFLALLSNITMACLVFALGPVGLGGLAVLFFET